MEALYNDALEGLVEKTSSQAFWSWRSMGQRVAPERQAYRCKLVVGSRYQNNSLYKKGLLYFEKISNQVSGLKASNAAQRQVFWNVKEELKRARGSQTCQKRAFPPHMSNVIIQFRVSQEGSSSPGKKDEQEQFIRRLLPFIPTLIQSQHKDVTIVRSNKLLRKRKTSINERKKNYLLLLRGHISTLIKQYGRSKQKLLFS